MLAGEEDFAVELTRLFLDRLATGGPRFNALAELTPELAARLAQRVDLMAPAQTASVRALFRCLCGWSRMPEPG